MIRSLNEELKSKVEEGAEELKKSRAFLENVIENIPDPIYIKDQDCRFVVVNKAFCCTHKVGRDEKYLGKLDIENRMMKYLKRGRILCWNGS